MHEQTQFLDKIRTWQLERISWTDSGSRSCTHSSQMPLKAWVEAQVRFSLDNPPTKIVMADLSCSGWHFSHSEYEPDKGAQNPTEPMNP